MRVKKENTCLAENAVILCPKEMLTRYNFFNGKTNKSGS